MSRVFVNTAANLVGKGAVALLSLVSLPFYLHYLGPEASGILGFFNTFLVIATILDLGIGVTVNKALASYDASDSRDLVVTLEIIYLGLGLVLGLAFFVLCETMASNWFQSKVLSTVDVKVALQLIALSLVLYWPYILYSNGLMGLQSQTECNLIQVFMTALRVVGGGGLVYYFDGTMRGVLVWYAATFMLQSLWARISLRRKLPEIRRGRFNLDLLKKIRYFISGMGLLSFTSVVLMQVDKLLLSHTLSLAEYGYYTLLSSLAAGLIFIAQPIFTAFFPALCSAVAQRKRSLLKQRFVEGAHVMALAMFPVFSVFLLFADEIVYFWLKDGAVMAVRGPLIFGLLALGYCLNAVVVMPYALQLAYGWTRLNLVQNCVAISLFVPTLLLLPQKYQSLGAATSWFLLNLLYVLVGMQLVFRRILRELKMDWYKKAVLFPGGISLISTLILKGVCAKIGISIFWTIALCYGVTTSMMIAVFHNNKKNWGVAIGEAI